jgi:trimeric autotransporter adhesin
LPPPPTTTLAFSMHDYLVFAVPSVSTALVVASSDAAQQDSPGISWSTTDNAIPDIYQTSISPPCNGNVEGSCTSDIIVAYYNSVPLSDYAAGVCYEITTDLTGTVTQGTWFLPAICTLNSSLGSTFGSGCTDNMPSIYTNLYNLGFLQEMAASYWASTECAYANSNPANTTDQCNGDSATYGWAGNFGGDNNTFVAPKSFALGARCVRSFDY